MPVTSKTPIADLTCSKRWGRIKQVTRVIRSVLPRTWVPELGFRVGNSLVFGMLAVYLWSRVCLRKRRGGSFKALTRDSTTQRFGTHSLEKAIHS